MHELLNGSRGHIFFYIRMIGQAYCFELYWIVCIAHNVVVTGWLKCLLGDYCTSWWLLYNALLYCVVITVLCGCYRAAPVFVWWTSSWQRWTVWRRGSKSSSWAPQTDQVRTDLYTQALMSYCDWTENQSDITSF